MKQVNVVRKGMWVETTDGRDAQILTVQANQEDKSNIVALVWTGTEGNEVSSVVFANSIDFDMDSNQLKTSDPEVVFKIELSPEDLAQLKVLKKYNEKHVALEEKVSAAKSELEKLEKEMAEEMEKVKAEFESKKSEESEKSDDEDEIDVVQELPEVEE